MKGIKSGFTLIEVSLFLAITALLFFGVTLGVRGSIFQQRYNDSVQNFAEFLRTAYSEVTNVEHAGTGASERAVYGKLLSFGETRDLAGNSIVGGNKVFSYTLVGKVGNGCVVSNSGSVDCPDDILPILANLKINVVDNENQLVGIPQEYTPRWGAGIQTTEPYVGGYQPFKGMILIVRHPETGAVYTYFSDYVMEVNDYIRRGEKVPDFVLNEGVWQMQPINFCVNPFGEAESSTRRDVRIIKNAQNASGVEIISQDGVDNQCQ